MNPLSFDEVIIEDGSDTGPIYRNLRQSLTNVSFKFVERSGPRPLAISRQDSFGAAKKTLYLSRHKGDFLKKCPGSEGQ
ncbi:MAG TPA: hypothetical protein VJQ55_05215, partial [Candidatus Binatia bacterium]|nr:hypothetical protein [Candidatus Binatia bacterium]